MRMRCPTDGTCLKRSDRAAHSSTMTTMAGWISCWLTAALRDFFKPKKRLSHALYKNNRDGTFTDVTERAGLTAELFGMGVVVGDYDNDGLPDILITAYGSPVLYHNNGDGTFTDVTAKSKLNVPGWTTSGVWFDYDGDGRLDLFLCSFVEYRSDSITCGDNKLGRNYYCIPRVFKPTANLLYHNNGDGTFTEVGQRNEIAKALGKGLGVVATDVNNDGRLDLFVANDTVQNFLFINRGQNKWEEAGLSAEVGFSDNGQPRSGMGVDSRPISTAMAGRIYLSPTLIRRCSLFTGTTAMRPTRTCPTATAWLRRRAS